MHILCTSDNSLNFHAYFEQRLYSHSSHTLSLFKLSFRYKIPVYLHRILLIHLYITNNPISFLGIMALSLKNDTEYLTGEQTVRHQWRTSTLSIQGKTIKNTKQNRQTKQTHTTSPPRHIYKRAVSRQRSVHFSLLTQGVTPSVISPIWFSVSPSSDSIKKP